MSEKNDYFPVELNDFAYEQQSKILFKKNEFWSLINWRPFFLTWLKSNLMIWVLSESARETIGQLSFNDS